MQLGPTSFTLIAETDQFITVSATNDLVINLKISSLSWEKSFGLYLLRFLDISATHALSPYSMFLSIVTSYGYHYTSPSIINMWAQVHNLCSDVTYVSNNTVVPSVLNGINISFWSSPNYRVLSNESSDTGIPNYLIWYGFMS